MKNDFGGHDNHHFNNICKCSWTLQAKQPFTNAYTHTLDNTTDAYAGQALGVCTMLDGHEDFFYGAHTHKHTQAHTSAHKRTNARARTRTYIR